MPIAVSTTLTHSVGAGLRRAQVRTHGGKEHETGEGDSPEVHGVDYVAAIELEEPVLDVSAASNEELTIRQSANQPPKRNMTV